MLPGMRVTWNAGGAEHRGTIKKRLSASDRCTPGAYIVLPDDSAHVALVANLRAE